MLKKLLILLPVLLVLLCSPIFAWTGNYSVVCVGCEQHYQKTHTGCFKCYAWRAFEEESKDGKYKGYMVYHCQHGHTMLIPYNTDKRTKDLNEIIILPKK